MNAGSSSYDDLAQLLIRLEDVLVSNRVPVVDRLAPGLHEKAVRELLGTLGMDPPDDLLTWFGWHNGLVWRGDEQPGDVFLVRWIPYSLSEAIAEYHDQPVGREPWQWHPDWLPIAHLRNADRLAVCCGSDAGDRGLVRVVSGVERFWHDPPARTTISDLAAWLAQAVEAGHWAYEAHDHVWSADRWTEIDAARRRTGLV